MIIIKSKSQKKLSIDNFYQFKKGHFKLKNGKGRFYKYVSGKIVFQEKLFKKNKFNIECMLVDRGYLITKVSYVELEAPVEKFDDPFSLKRSKKYEIRKLFLIIYNIEVYKPLK